MKERTAVIFGASGLTGKLLTQQLLNDEYYTTVRVLLRNKLAISHTKLQQVTVNFNDPEDFSNKFGTGEVIFCCIGTTNKKVKGDTKAYEKIDVDIPVLAAQIGISHGFEKFLIISSAGANANSKNSYLRIKGNLEKKIQQLPFSSISIFRPGQLLGNRTEYRRGEYILQKITTLLSLLLAGKLKKYRSIAAQDVAKAMIAQSKQTAPGIHILEYNEMMNLIR